MHFFLFFFFKQKTAYEIKECDWSSDVCSSDLFPVKVDDANKPQKLTDVLPVLGTPVKIRLVQYLPDLNWTTAAVEDPNGEIVVKLTVKGKGMKQDVWLSSDDPAKQSVSSRIGGIELKKLRNGDNIGKILREITEDRKSTRLNSSHIPLSRMPSSA